jgi:hypothetical protein
VKRKAIGLFIFRFLSICIYHRRPKDKNAACFEKQTAQFSNMQSSFDAKRHYAGRAYAYSAADSIHRYGSLSPSQNGKAAPFPDATP